MQRDDDKILVIRLFIYNQLLNILYILSQSYLYVIVVIIIMCIWIEIFTNFIPIKTLT